MSHLSILNVGEGDTKLSFDRDNPAERIRAARIVTDMLRRGYALLVQIGTRDGKPEYQRVHAFDEERCEYIIADFDPTTAEKDHAEDGNQASQNQEGEALREKSPQGATSGKGRRKGRRIPAEGTQAVGVARSAGG